MTDLVASAPAREPWREPPLGLLAELTHRCPLACPYCSNPLELVARDRELPTEVWLRVLRQAAELGVLQVHLSGGEPTLRTDLETIVAEARALELYTNLITAGVGLSARRLEALVAAGLDHVQLSVQDVDPEGCDRIGGFKGSLPRKLELARAVRAAGLPLTINAVVHRHNLDRLERFVELALELGADRLEVANVQYYGWAWVNRAALMPTRAQLDHAVAVVERARATWGDRLAIDFVVRAHHQSWNDANGNYQHDPPQETRKGWALAAAVTRRPPGSTRQEEQGRAVVLADSDALSDQVLALTARMRGNADFVLDGLKWLLGDEAIAGSTNTEQDVPITRTRTQDVVWFFASVFVAPAVIVGAGVLAVRKRKRRSRVGKGGAS